MFSRDYRIGETSRRNGTVKNKTGSNFTLITKQKPTDAKACEKLNTRLHVNVQAAAAHVQKYSLPTATRAVPTTAEDGGMESNEKEDVRIALNLSKGDQDDGTLNAGRVEGIAVQCVCVCGGGICFMRGV